MNPLQRNLSLLSLFRLRSLKARIAVTTLLILLAGLWSLSYFTSRMLRQDMERVLSAQQLSTVTLLATHINDELQSLMRLATITARATGPAMQAGSAATQAFLENRIAQHDLFNGGLFVVNTRGQIVADSPVAKRRVGAMFSDNDAINAALHSGKTAISRPFSGGGPKAPIFTVTAPIFNTNNEIVGALSGVIDLGSPNFLDHIENNRYGKTGMYMLIAPRHQLIITSTERRRVMEATLAPGINPAIDGFLTGRENSAVHLNPLGVEMLTSAKHVPAADWTIIADLPTAEAFEPVREIQHHMQLATVLLSLLTFVLIGWMLKRQLSQLDSATKRLAELPDERLQALPIVYDDEVGQLIRRFNHILAILQQRETALRESEERFRTLHDASFGGISIHDQGGIIDCNQGLSDMSGYSKEELLGLERLQLVAPECRDEVMQKIRSSYDFPYEVVGLRKDGSRYPMSVLGKNILYRGKSVRVTEFRDISERKQAEEALRVREESFRNFFDKNSSVMILTDPFSGQIILANDAACDYYGYPKDQLIGMNISAINTMAPTQIAEQRLRALHGECNTFYFVHRLASGELRDVEVHLSPIENNGRALLFSIIHDITERKLVEEKLHLAASVFSHAREGILITRADGTIIDVNDSFTRITGYSRSEAIGRNPHFLSSGRQNRDFYTGMWEALSTNGHWYGELWNTRKNGELFAVLQTISAVFDARGIAQHYVSLFSDITALKEHEKQLEHIAHYDVLTTLPNRVLLADRMKQAMIHAERSEQLMAVAYLDLDDFKAINDRYGHETGDRLLITLSERMKLALRESDTLARIGGDEFIAVLKDFGDTTSSTPLLSRLLSAAATPVMLGDLVLEVSASVGVTFFPQAEDVDADQLLRQADQAMYQAKLAGKNRYHLFDAEQDRNVRGHHESLEHIRRALAAREFVLHYQPKVNMRTGVIIGAEALIRWQHPETGLLPPAVFLPVIEDHPLAIEIGEWVIETALFQLERWQTDGLDMPLSVNVGARQLLHGNFAQRLRECLDRHPSIPPGKLEIEVLETSALEDLVKVSQIIEDCQSLGVSFALDDFGTGYSSLTYLKRLSVNQLKIDQSFVRDMLDDPDDLSILGGVLSMATAFRRQVLAEGVETVAHGTMLLQLGCELAQGYGIARPMPADKLKAWAATWHPDTSWSSMRPARRDDLPLLFAGIEHRAWVTAVEDFLEGKRRTLPLAHHQCRFSSWLEDEGKTLHHAHPALPEIVALHQEMHELAHQLCEHRSQDHTEQFPGGLDRLRALRDQLLEQLQILVTDDQLFPTGKTDAEPSHTRH